MTLRSRSRKDRLACAWGRRFSGKERKFCHPERFFFAAKDLCNRQEMHRILRFAQDDSRVFMLAIHESDSGVSFAVRVHPRAKKNAITGELGDMLKVSLTTPPVEGRATTDFTVFFPKFWKGL